MSESKLKFLHRYLFLEYKLRLQNLRSFTFGYLEDCLDAVLGKRDTLTPPMSIRLKAGDFWSARYYRNKGKKYFKSCKTLCKVRPSDHILDIGCGCGQMAVQSLRYLTRKGSYTGVDINQEEINWCKKNIEPIRENFQFSLLDIFNKIYNPQGRHNASSFKFPYKNSTFDFIILISVFTHMTPKGMENYVSEISRLLKKGGRCFITFFLLNPDAIRHMDKKLNTIEFPNDYGQYRLLDESTPEVAIAYKEQYIRKIFLKHGLTIKEPIHFGSWCGRRRYWDYQDLVIITK